MMIYKIIQKNQINKLQKSLKCYKNVNMFKKIKKNILKLKKEKTINKELKNYKLH